MGKKQPRREYAHATKKDITSSRAATRTLRQFSHTSPGSSSFSSSPVKGLISLSSSCLLTAASVAFVQRIQRRSAEAIFWRGGESGLTVAHCDKRDDWRRMYNTRDLITLGEHVQRGLLYLVCKPVYLPISYHVFCNYAH